MDAENVLAEAIRSTCRPHDEQAVAEYMRVRERLNTGVHNRPPGANARRPDDIDQALWDAVEDYYSRDEEIALTLILQTVSLCNKYRLPVDEYARAVTAAYRLGTRAPRVRAALEGQ